MSGSVPQNESVDAFGPRPRPVAESGTRLAHGRPAPRFSGWRILAVAVVGVMLTGPGQTIGVSVFIDPMVATLGVSRSVVSTMYLVGTLVGASTMPLFGRAIDRVGVRRAQVLVGVGFSVSLASMAGVSSTVWLAIGFAGIRMFGQGALGMISTVSVSLWFERRRGVAMGVLATVGGAGLATVPLVLNAGIQWTSWRATWLLAAGIIAGLVIPLGWFGLIDRPGDVDQAPDGWVGDPTTDDVASPNPTRPSATRAQAIRTSQFWVLATIGVATSMLITGLNFHQIDLLAEAGLSSGRAAAMFLPQIVGSSVAGIAVGYLIDRVGVRFVPAAMMALLITVHLLATGLSSGALVVFYAISLGATGGGVRAALSTILPGYFGVDHIGSIQGVMTLAVVAGSAIGPVTLAVVEDRLGSYQAANSALVVIPAAVLVVALFNRAPAAG